MPESWDMSQERAFIENLLCQRFNFFIVIFSLVIAGAASANTKAKLVSILWVGATLCVLLALATYRVYVKLIWILRHLHAISDHPVHVSSEGIKTMGMPILFGVNVIVGVVIPVGCCLVLLTGAILASTEILKAS
jgi:hypothetical protein